MYGERIVAFIDLLGFKNAVYESVYDVDIKRRIQAIFDILNREFQDTYKEDDNFSLSKATGKEMTFFSDCVVISYNEKAMGGIFYTLIDLVHLCIDFGYNGFLVRGGVVCGEIYHKKNVCYGPAMNVAYLLESKIAQNPMIRIDKSIFKSIEKYKAEHHSIMQEYEYIFHLLKTDNKTGAYYLDYLAQYQEFDSFDYYCKYLKKIKKEIECNLLYYREDNKVLEKYQWYKEYYNEVIKQQIEDDYQNLFLIK